jgi:signal peptidase II
MVLKKITFLAIVAGSVLVLDLFTKMLIMEHLPLGAGFPVIPGLFDLTHVRNPGGAFGFLATMGPRAGVTYSGTVLAVAVILVLMHTPVQQNGWPRVTSFRRAIGNPWTAAVRGGDRFSCLLRRPAGRNIADSAITVGDLCVPRDVPQDAGMIRPARKRPSPRRARHGRPSWLRSATGNSRPTSRTSTTPWAAAARAST